MTDAEFTNPRAASGAAPDQERRADKTEGDDHIERTAPRRQIGPRACDEKERYRDNELDDREREEGQEATPAALFI